MDWLLNNPVLFTILIIVIVLIAVGLILYFLVFKQKIQEILKARKIKKEQILAENAESQDLVSNVFKRNEVKNDKKSSEEFDEKLKMAVNQSKNQRINAQNFDNQIKKEAEEPELKEGEEIDIKKIMSQFSSNKKK